MLIIIASNSLLAYNLLSLMPEQAHFPLRVFLCHSPKDNPIARELYHRLDAEGWMDVWFIEDRLLPSQNWEPEILKGVENADVVIALLSKNSHTEEKTHYPSWHFVFDVIQISDNKQITVIPLLLDDVKLPTVLNMWQSIRYFPKNQRRSIYQKILEILKALGQQLGLSLDRRLPPSAPEKRLQWTPSLWKQLNSEDIEVETESKQTDSRLIRARQKLRLKFFSGVNNLFVWAAAIGTLSVISICALMVNAIVGGENTNSFTAPIISRALTLVPLPTPTLGVGSVHISPKDGMRIVYVPAGEFRMGSNDHQDDEKPVHNVYLEAFWIDQYEVTNGMYAKCVEANICSVPFPNEYFFPDFAAGQDTILFLNEHSKYLRQLEMNPDLVSQPVMGIFWDNANAYCRWVNRRLPTEAEWEKAARGMDRRTYPWGEEVDCKKANLYSCVDNPSRVGSFEGGQSPYGAYDMAGNAMEWVADWYGRSYYQESPYENPLGPRTGLYRVYRGGSWNSEEAASRTTNRPGYVANLPNEVIGFRCASSE